MGICEEIRCFNEFDGRTIQRLTYYNKVQPLLPLVLVQPQGAHSLPHAGKRIRRSRKGMVMNRHCTGCIRLHCNFLIPEAFHCTLEDQDLHLILDATGSWFLTP